MIRLSDHRPALAPSFPRLAALSRDECLLRLGRAGVGRLGVTVNAMPAIFPVNYAMFEGDVVFRTGRGTKLDAATERAVVAFEVDRIDPIAHTGWSVMVVGVADVVADEPTLARVGHLPVRPWAAGGRDTFVRIQAARMTGRELR